MAKVKIIRENAIPDPITAYDCTTLRNEKYEAVCTSENGSDYYQHQEISLEWAYQMENQEVPFSSLSPQLQKRLIEEFGEEAFKEA